MHEDPNLEELRDAILQSLSENEGIKPKNMEPPEILPIFPINRRPFFPGMAAPVIIEAGPYYEAVKRMMKNDDKWIGLFLTKKENASPYKLTEPDLYSVGVAAKIIRVIPMDLGGAQLIVNMEKRATFTTVMQEGKRLKAKVQYHTDTSLITREMKAYSASIISTIKELLKMNPLFKEELQIFLSHSDLTEPGKLADFAVALTTSTREELQEVLDTFDIPRRVDKALKLLRKELDLSQLQNRINQKIDATITKSQKEYFLREQLKNIKKELGLEKDDKSMDLEKFEKRLKKKIVPEDVKKTIEEETSKFSLLEPHSSEFGVTRNYLDWLTNMPWGVQSPDKYELSQAREILDEDHYGLDDIKKRILEFIAVSKLSKGMKGNILCLVGPPGVGKTSIGKSVSRALNRKFFRFSVGGMRDEAEIKGHRRTYVGAQPGKIIQALKHCQTMNPVIMIDEIDKIGMSHQGDPASALLEVLDKEQNNEFLDHYLDVRVDLSNILFIVTANILDQIPEPLLDRMEVLRLSGYILQEKMEIAKRYLIPKNKKEMGIKNSQFQIEDSALHMIINGYAREAGVRSLENHVRTLLRKAATQIVDSSEKKKPFTKWILKEKHLSEHLGKPRFTCDKFYVKIPVGVATGLAWTAMGGATLYIEAIKIHSEKTEMKLTGQAGNVMKESSEIAWSYVHSAVKRYHPAIPFFEKSQIHIHIPEGATPKDGPSAGITMATSLISLLLDKPIKDELGMTGELTLTGHVLPIGGVKEKIIAAKRSGLNTLIFPLGNVRDYEELDKDIKKDIAVHFVSHYDEVFEIVFKEKSVENLGTSLSKEGH